MQQITIAGHLGADPEVRFTSTGEKVTVLRVAVRTRKKGKDETTWWRVSVWGDQFDKMMTYLKKGSGVIIFGEMLIPEIFMDRSGQPQISLNIKAYNLLFSPFGKPEGASANSASSGKPQERSQNSEEIYSAMGEQAVRGQGEPLASFHEDEIPF